MKLLQKIISDIGSPYEIRNVDMEDVIYRRLDNGYEFEVSGIYSSSGKCTLYVWGTDPKKVVGIYSGVPVRSLKDFLGYYAVRYQNLVEQIQVEREEIIV